MPTPIQNLYSAPFSTAHKPNPSVQIRLLRGAAERAVWRRGTVVFVQSGRISLSQCMRVGDSTLQISQRLNEGEAHTIDVTACYDVLARCDTVVCCELAPSMPGLLWRGLKRTWGAARSVLRMGAGSRSGLRAQAPHGRAAAGP